MMRRLSPFGRHAAYDMQDALLAHADSLASGQDDADALLARYPDVRRPLESLFGLARMARDALPPVEPAEAFVTDLKDRLAAARRDPAWQFEHLQREKRKMALQIAGVTGLLVSGVAMLALGIHFIISIVSRRRATTAA